MGIYILLLLFTMIFYFFSKRLKNGKDFFLIIIFTLLSLIAGLRNYEVGIDTPSYVLFFERIPYIAIQDFNVLRFEYGFSYLCKIISYLTNDYHIFLLITSTIINFGVFVFIKRNSNNYLLSTLLYILCNFYLNNMNIMRESIAISIILLGFEFLKNDKYLKFALFVIFASLFHMSAIICFVFILLKKIKFNKKNIYLSFIIFALFFLFGETLFIKLCSLSPRLSSYIDSSWGKGNLFGAFLNFLIIIFQYIFGVIVLLKNKQKKINNSSSLLFTIMCATCAISLLVMRATIFDRFLYYFSIFMIIWTPNCIEMIHNKKNYYFISLLMITLFLSSFLVIGTFRPEWNGAIPYIFMD